MGQKIKHRLKKLLMFCLNPRFLLCFGLAWLITNGWSYILFGLGTLLDVGWMVAVGGGYMAFLWLPISPEKIVTVGISIALLKFLFPNDRKTLAVLVEMKDKIKAAVKKRKKKDQKEQDDFS